MTAMPAAVLLLAPLTVESGLRPALLAIIGVLGLTFAWVFISSIRRLKWSANPPAAVRFPNPGEILTGFVTTFFDTLGIGSYATTTAVFRASGLVPDELIPGTLNVGHTATSVLGAFVFIGLIPVDPATLGLMILATGLGAWVGAGLVAALPRYGIRLGMGSALLVAASLMFLTQLHLLPGGGDALGLHGGALVVAVLGNFLFGGLTALLSTPCTAPIFPALLAWAARPLLNEVIDRFPAPQVKVADAEICAIGNVERRSQRGQEIQLDVVKYPGHKALHEWRQVCATCSWCTSQFLPMKDHPVDGWQAAPHTAQSDPPQD